MGIIVNDLYVDNRGFTATQTYASFSSGINLRKVKKTIKTKITQEDASGNANAFSELIETEEGPVMEYYVNTHEDSFMVNADLVHYKDKESRLNGLRPIGNLTISLYINSNEISDLFTKLYENVKSNDRFPYTNIVDDL